MHPIHTSTAQAYIFCLLFICWLFFPYFVRSKSARTSKPDHNNVHFRVSVMQLNCGSYVACWKDACKSHGKIFVASWTAFPFLNPLNPLWGQSRKVSRSNHFSLFVLANLSRFTGIEMNISRFLDLMACCINNASVEESHYSIKRVFKIQFHHSLSSCHFHQIASKHCSELR